MTTYATDPWTALGHPTRRAIFEQVVAGPRSVGELAGDLPISRPAVSQHLKALKDAGLVAVRRAGNRRIYEVDRAGLAQLRTELDRYWSDTLAAYRRAVEEPPTGGPT